MNALDTAGDLMGAVKLMGLKYHTVWWWLKDGEVLEELGNELRKSGALKVYEKHDEPHTRAGAPASDRDAE